MSVFGQIGRLFTDRGIRLKLLGAFLLASVSLVPEFLAMPPTAQARDVVRRHAADFNPSSIEMRSSKNARYLSLTVTINARSREQLDALYSELSRHPMVMMVL